MPTEKLSLHLEAEARERADRFGRRDPAMLLGYLEASVRAALAKPRWRSRDRLAIDLRTVEIVWEEHHDAAG